MELEFISVVSKVKQNKIAGPPQQPVELNDEVKAVNQNASDRDVYNTARDDLAENADALRLAVSDEKLEELVIDLNLKIQITTRELRFSVDKKYGRPIVSVVDKETDQVIRQIPGHVALQVADALENATGALVSERA